MWDKKGYRSADHRISRRTERNGGTVPNQRTIPHEGVPDLRRTHARGEELLLEDSPTAVQTGKLLLEIPSEILLEHLVERASVSETSDTFDAFHEVASLLLESCGVGLERRQNRREAANLRQLVDRLPRSDINDAGTNEAGTENIEIDSVRRRKIRVARLLHLSRQSAEMSLHVLDCLNRRRQVAQNRFDRTNAARKLLEKDVLESDVRMLKVGTRQRERARGLGRIVQVVPAWLMVDTTHWKPSFREGL